MKRFISAFIFPCFFAFSKLHTQDISKLTVPTSPAFSILNFEPTAVMRPVNAKALAADVLNSFDKDGKLLMNLGLEVAPYWLKSHPSLKRETYLNPDLGQAFLQSFSLSAATVKDSVSGDNKLGAGFRFKLLNGRPVDELTIASTALNTKTTVVAIINGFKNVITPGGPIDTRQKAIDAIINALRNEKMDATFIADFKEEAEILANDYTDSIADIKDFLEQLLLNRVEAYGELAKMVSDLLYERTGFVLEFAGATGFNITNGHEVEKIGFWGNASHYVSPDDLFTLTARFMHQNDDTSLTNFDIGLGFLKKTTKYNISVETMLRWDRAEIPDFNINNEPIKRVEKQFTYRLAVQGTYLISKDVSINLSLGKDFDSPFISTSGFFSILGFNCSIFSKKPTELK